MKSFFRILAGVAIVSAVACKKTDTDNYIIPDAPDTGVYMSSQYTSSQITITRNIAYSTRPNPNKQYTSDSTIGTDTLASTLTMTMDVFLPPNATASAKQPAVIYIHGGNFLAGDKSNMEDETMTYAMAGYVAVSINYRLTPNNESSSLLRIQAIINATEDAGNAIRFLKHHRNDYYIDTTRMATIGSSAGGGVSLINATEYDNILLTPSDFPGVYSARVAGAISTGATLIENGINTTDYITFDSNDTPILLFHANPEDGYRHTTWTGNVLPTQELINNSGNECTIVAQPDMTHTVNLSVGGTYWSDLKKFLWKKLKLYEL